MQSIYERIEILIKQKGMTKKLFCENLCISTGNFGDWKRGKSTPSTNKLIEIAAYFNVTLDWLILGRESDEIVLREDRGTYGLENSSSVPRLLNGLTEQEKHFIKEYIEFTSYRKKSDPDE
ncbi:helix-turn-helix domain-containing protein [Paenibacillus pini]|uniref:HTH cro/C1-type domain-containing protein n=1 Tax=Paenibacillus pini JCM 16418 TaxID=1236976 RepID=W7YKH8_9BACL|nr:helix-turn-helix transcriptional regulator [Paenibacillus pini]GAF08188.1 hypothetical protein JCM16418_2229 [Paenibacillus pini JCM 16418]